MPITQRESHSASDRKRGRAWSDPSSCRQDHRRGVWRGLL